MYADWVGTKIFFVKLIVRIINSSYIHLDLIIHLVLVIESR